MCMGGHETMQASPQMSPFLFLYSSRLSDLRGAPSRKPPPINLGVTEMGRESRARKNHRVNMHPQLLKHKSV